MLSLDHIHNPMRLNSLKSRSTRKIKIHSKAVQASLTYIWKGFLKRSIKVPTYSACLLCTCPNYLSLSGYKLPTTTNRLRPSRHSKPPHWTSFSPPLNIFCISPLLIPKPPQSYSPQNPHTTITFNRQQTSLCPVISAGNSQDS